MINPMSEAAFQTAASQHPAARKYAAVNNHQCIVHSPPGVRGEGEHGLPPESPVVTFDPSEFDLNHFVDRMPALRADVDAFERLISRPGHAVRVFLALPGRGLWFDFRTDDVLKRHTAVIVESGGVNAVDMRVEETRADLRWYDSCPLHPDHHRPGTPRCGLCDNDWPRQNFVTNSGQMKPFWLDGFRDGKGVSQFLFTDAAEGRGVAQQIRGDARYNGFLLSFRDSITPRVARAPTGGGGYGYVSPGLLGGGGAARGLESFGERSFVPEVAAGARIRQELEVDMLKQDGWLRPNGQTREPGALLLVPLFPSAFQAFIASYGETVRRERGSSLRGIKHGNP